MFPLTVIHIHSFKQNTKDTIDYASRVNMIYNPNGWQMKQLFLSFAMTEFQLQPAAGAAKKQTFLTHIE